MAENSFVPMKFDDICHFLREKAAVLFKQFHDLFLPRSDAIHIPKILNEFS